MPPPYPQEKRPALPHRGGISAERVEAGISSEHTLSSLRTGRREGGRKGREERREGKEGKKTNAYEVTPGEHNCPPFPWRRPSGDQGLLGLLLTWCPSCPSLTHLHAPWVFIEHSGEPPIVILDP